MERILVILSEEQEYARELALYLGSRADFIFRPVVFHDLEAYRRFATDNHIDMLLCDEEFVRSVDTELTADYICVLSELGMVGEEDGYSTIFKYQSSQDILKALIEAYGKRKKNVEGGTAPTGSRIISVFSPIGGARSSTYALALSEYYARGGRTLFISFDPFFMLPGDVKNPKDKNLSDLLYYLDIASKGTGVRMSIPGMIEKISSQRGNLNYMTGAAHWFDIMDASTEAVHELLEALSGSSKYETVVFDLGMVGTFCLEILVASSYIYVPIYKGGNYNATVQEWRRQIEFGGEAELLEKVHEVEIPYDELLDGPYRFDQLLQGKLGKFIEEKEGCGYIR